MPLNLSIVQASFRGRNYVYMLFGYYQSALWAPKSKLNIFPTNLFIARPHPSWSTIIFFKIDHAKPLSGCHIIASSWLQLDYMLVGEGMELWDFNVMIFWVVQISVIMHGHGFG